LIWTRFIDLSEQELYVHEKLFAVEMYYTEKEKDASLSERTFSSMHGLGNSTFNDWKKHYDELKSTCMLKMRRKRGRPPYLDCYAVEEVRRRLAELVCMQKTPGKEEFIDLITDGTTTKHKRKNFFLFPGRVRA
jgi:transposase